MAAATGDKAPGAFKTIGELSHELGVAQPILRYWETKFPQLRPLQRAGNRRYYRPADVHLAHRINRLLNQDGYTVRGVQKLLRDRNGDGTDSDLPSAGQAQAAPPRTASVTAIGADAVHDNRGIDVTRLQSIRDRLAAILDD